MIHIDIHGWNLSIEDADKEQNDVLNKLSGINTN